MLAITEDSKITVVFYSFCFGEGKKKVQITTNEGKRTKNKMPGETVVSLLGCCDFSSLPKIAKATKLQLIS